MLEHLNKHKLITYEQHGFVSSKSCLTNLLESLDIVTEAFNRGFASVIVFLDFAKAFDKVSHRALILKIRAYGFDGNLLDWLSDFLTGRKQRVVLGDVVSDWTDVLSGVPQGSVLGPLLFLLFINDMPGLVECLCKLFADDTKLIKVIRNKLDIRSLQLDLNRLVDWSKTWNMSFNTEKCKFMVFNNKWFEIELRMSGIVLLETVVERDLGIFIANNLKWRYQTEQAVNKARMVLGQLRNAFKYWNITTFKHLYTTLVRPHLEYAVAAWNPQAKKDISALEAVQMNATKLVPSLRSLSYEDRLVRLGLTSLKERRSRADLIEYYKITNGFSIVNWHNPNRPCCSLDAKGPAAGIRGSSHRITRQLTKNQQRFNFLPNRVASSWNSLPDMVVKVETKNGFKNKLDQYLNDKVQY